MQISRKLCYASVPGLWECFKAKKTREVGQNFTGFAQRLIYNTQGGITLSIQARSDEPDKEKKENKISFKEYLKIRNYFSRTVHNPDAFYQGED